MSILTGCILYACCNDHQGNKDNGMVDKLANEKTAALYANMQKNGTDGVMFGHQDDTAYGIGWKYERGRSDVQSVTGDYPAVYGWEIGGIERGKESSLDNITMDKIRNLALEAYKRGGINTISWHADNIVTGSDSWDVSGGNVVATLLPGGANHTEYIQRLDMVADFLGSIKDENGVAVPILFRPFHEHNKGWFWWGADHCSAQEYKALWKLTVDRMVKDKGIHNLIFIYSPDRVASTQEYMERYPGDEYVDIVGLDLYHFNGTDGLKEFETDCDRSLAIAAGVGKERNKPFVFSETGLECVTMDKWFTQVLMPLVAKHRPGYVLVWRNAYEKPNHYYAPYPGHSAAADLNDFKQRDEILFSSEINDMYTIH